MMRADAEFAIYVHWPFCKSKCPYCDFNSHVRASIDEARWRRRASRRARPLRGGDPGPRRHLDLLRRRHAVADDGGDGGGGARPHRRSAGRCDPAVEITLEANPTSVEAERFREFRAAGVTRASLGVQALDDGALKFLGRAHDAREALAALDVARRNFERFSFDLIYARPGQTVAAWEAELGRALDLAGEHLSVYQLTIEAGTAFATAYARGDFVLPDEETQATLYELTQARLEAAGLPAYEISNHARPGAECRHNLAYWHSADYVGVGPGAHGRLTLDGTRVATRQSRAPETWLAAAERQGHGSEARVVVTADEHLEEVLMMGLRLTEGISRVRFRRSLGREIEAALDEKRLAPLIDGGFLTLDETGLAATAAGRQRLNAVLAAIVG